MGTDIKLLPSWLNMNHYESIKTDGYNKDWYQLAAKQTNAALGNAVCSNQPAS